MAEKLTPIICPDSFNGNSKLNFYHFYEFAQNTKSLPLKVHDKGPYCPNIIIHYSKEILTINDRGLFVGSPYIYMDQVKALLSNGIANRKGQSWLLS